MFGFVAKHRGIWPAATICEALGVSRSGFYGWLSRSPSDRARRHEAMLSAILQSFLDSDRTYGARRVWHDLLEAGIACGLHAVERLMKLNALRARPRRRRLPTDTGERHVTDLAANVLDRQFEAAQPSARVPGADIHSSLGRVSRRGACPNPCPRQTARQERGSIRYHDRGSRRCAWHDAGDERCSHQELEDRRLRDR